MAAPGPHAQDVAFEARLPELRAGGAVDGVAREANFRARARARAHSRNGHALRGARALCGVGACPLSIRERRAWGDLEAFDAILGNYDRANNIFYRGRRIAPLDHNHVGRNLTIARIGWRWCDASPAVAHIVRAAAAREVVHEGCATTDGSLFAAVACEAAPDVLPENFRIKLDANAAAYAAHW